MLDVTEQELFEQQTRRYGGHEFTMLTGEPIIISQGLPLADAVDNYNRLNKELGSAEFTGHFIHGYERNQIRVKELRYQVERAKAECMAAFYRAAQCWPKDAKEALGF